MITKETTAKVKCQICGAEQEATMVGYKRAHKMMIVSWWSDTTHRRHYADFCSWDCVRKWLEKEATKTP